jgi:hypothetical protein
MRRLMDMHVCSCTPRSLGGDSCGSNSCINRGCKIECDPQTCPCGIECENNRMQKSSVLRLRCGAIGPLMLTDLHMLHMYSLSSHDMTNIQIRHEYRTA